MDVSDVSAKQRFAAGAVLAVVGSTATQLDLGTRVGSFALVFGIGFLGASLEPPITRALGHDEWDDLGTVAQVVVLFVLGLVAIVLYAVVTFGADLAATAVL